MQKVIRVKMLGKFSIEYNGHCIDDSSNRMRKVWLLLAYVICNRANTISIDDYISLLSSKATNEPVDPSGNLKALFYRARALLDKLDDDAGHKIIIRCDGSYGWSSEFKTVLDIEEFESLCRRSDRCDNTAERLLLLTEAISMYEGDFIPKLSAEIWAIHITEYYHRLYLEAVEKALSILYELQQYDKAADICQRAVKIEPYSEALYQNLMRCKIALGDKVAAQTIYEDMSELLFSNFGVMPSDKSRALYREASKSDDTYSVQVGTFRENLKETDEVDGALYCEYDFFRVLYQAQARAVARSGDSIHIALLSVHGKNGKQLARRSLDTAVENLKSTVLANLRQGDIVTQCSVSQLILMLPQANYENSCMVCERLLRAFNKQYPHSPIDIHFSVQPLEPIERPSGKEENK
ncbi:MAG: bacterial transcriptional activator domain-containing protein [Oscillospiraceae bacterium]|nr:bacterial transcriptional activator domain-containing protein [Oscillospiraceae bacterium]